MGMLPPGSSSAEILPFLSTDLTAELVPASQTGGSASLLLTYSARREGKIAQTICTRFLVQPPGSCPRAAGANSPHGGLRDEPRSGQAIDAPRSEAFERRSPRGL